MKIATAIVVALIVLLGVNSLFLVREGQTALVLQFGRIIRSDGEPGLHVKLPLIQQALTFDNRMLTLEGQPERYFTAEKKSVNVDFYVEWRILDDAAYYRATSGDELQATQRLSSIVKDALRFEVNEHPLQDLISGGREDVIERVHEQTDASARKNLGIAVVDVRIKRIDFPDEVSDSVYKRMRAERLQLANQLRSTGQQAAETIQADADRQVQVIKADADRDAEKIRGEGDAQAAAIYAQAYGQDPDFFAFYRSLGAYRKAFGDGGGTLILKPDSEFLKYFNDGGAKR